MRISWPVANRSHRQKDASHEAGTLSHCHAGLIRLGWVPISAGVEPLGQTGRIVEAGTRRKDTRSPERIVALTTQTAFPKLRLDVAETRPKGRARWASAVGERGQVRAEG